MGEGVLGKQRMKEASAVNPSLHRNALMGHQKCRWLLSECYWECGSMVAKPSENPNLNLGQSTS